MSAREPLDSPGAWADCRFLTCSVLPVRSACDLRCHFCFSHSSISADRRPRLRHLDLDRYYRWAKDQGATRLVVTGGGEPLLRPDDALHAVQVGAAHFDEIALFTNGSRLTRELARAFEAAGLSYLCWSRHATDDAANRALMGPGAPDRAQVIAAAGDLPIRATCVMTRGQVDSRAAAFEYIEAFAALGVRQFTFKHTYIAYAGSVWQESAANRWARAHQVEFDPFVGLGVVIGRLPWGPEIRRIGPHQVCWYREPTPDWEKEHRLCRSTNLLADGAIYASLEDRQSLLWRLSASPTPSPPTTSRPCAP